MSCNCLQSNPIPTCAETLIVGAIQQINTAVMVRITSIATGRTDMIEGLSDADGLIEIDIEDYDINDGSNYKIEVFTANDVMGAPVTITIDDESNSCVYFTGEKLNGANITTVYLSTLGNDAPVVSTRPIYKKIFTDYTWDTWIETVGIADTSSVITVTMQAPQFYEKGKVFNIKDESGNGSINNPIVAAIWEDGTFQKQIFADRGSFGFYTDGVKFYVVETN